MAKLCFILLVHFLILVTLASFSYSQPNVINIHFFLHDKYVEPNRTVYPVAQSSITSTSPTSFGQVSVVDDPLTVGPEPGSEIIGYAQGLVAFADKSVMAFHPTLTFFFTGGKYKGSSFNVLGRYNLADKYRKIAIAGGTGNFSLARGIITFSTYSSNPNMATFACDAAIVPEYIKGVY